MRIGLVTIGLVMLVTAVQADEIKQLRGHNTAIRAIAMSPDGRFFASIATQGPICIWSIPRRELERTLSPGSMYQQSLAYSPDGKYLAVGQMDGLIRLWSISEGRVVRTLGDTDRRGGGYLGLAYSPDGKRLAGAIGPYLRIWEPSTGKLIATHHAPNRHHLDVAYSPDGKTIATGGFGRNIIQLARFALPVSTSEPIQLINAEDGKLIRELPVSASCVRFRPDAGSLLISGTIVQTAAGPAPRGRAGLMVNGMTLYSEDRVALLDLKTNQESHRQIDFGEVIALSADGRVMVCGSTNQARLNRNETGGLNLQRAPDPGIRILETSSGIELEQWKLEGSTTLELTPDGRTLVIGDMSGILRVWNWAGPPPERPTAAEIPYLWDALAQASGPELYQAIGRLEAEPALTMAWFKKHIQPAPRGESDRIQQLVANLDSREFTEREAAQAELARLGPQTAAVIQEAVESTNSAELRRRGLQLLTKFARARPSSDEMRTQRAVQIMERFASPEARGHLELLAKDGEPSSILTRQAQAALDRIRSRDDLR